MLQASALLPPAVAVECMRLLRTRAAHLLPPIRLRAAQRRTQVASVVLLRVAEHMERRRNRRPTSVSLLLEEHRHTIRTRSLAADSANRFRGRTR